MEPISLTELPDTLDPSSSAFGKTGISSEGVCQAQTRFPCEAGYIIYDSGWIRRADADETGQIATGDDVSVA